MNENAYFTILLVVVILMSAVLAWLDSQSWDRP